MSTTVKILLWIKAMELSQIWFCQGHFGLSRDVCAKEIMSMRKRFCRFWNQLHAVLKPHRANQDFVVVRLPIREGEPIEETTR